MDIIYFRDLCLAKKGVTESTPFGPDTLVFKVVGKLFALTRMDAEEFTCNLKCDPEYAEELRAQYPDIIPGYHMNKKHWNTIYGEREVEDELIVRLIDHSYDLVVKGFTRKEKEMFNSL